MSNREKAGTGMTTMTHESKQPTADERRVGRDLVQRAQRKWGHGWARLGGEQRRAAVAEEIVGLLLSQLGDDAGGVSCLQRITRAAMLHLEPGE
jgi:hypothetical protein